MTCSKKGNSEGSLVHIHSIVSDIDNIFHWSGLLLDKIGKICIHHLTSNHKVLHMLFGHYHKIFPQQLEYLHRWQLSPAFGNCMLKMAREKFQHINSFLTLVLYPSWYFGYHMFEPSHGPPWHFIVSVALPTHSIPPSWASWDFVLWRFLSPLPQVVLHVFQGVQEFQIQSFRSL